MVWHKLCIFFYLGVTLALKYEQGGNMRNLGIKNNLRSVAVEPTQYLTPSKWKKMKNLISAMVIILIAPPTFSSSLDYSKLNLELAGSMCLEKVGSHGVNLAEGSEIRLKIPLSTRLESREGVSIVRGNCTFALPVSAKANHKIIAANVKQVAQIHLKGSSEEGRAQTQLEVFQAGAKGEIIKLELQNEKHAQKLRQVIGENALVAETTCGGSMILRGNLATTLLGVTHARTYTSDLYVDLIEVPCTQ